jgi:serine protease Do
MEIEKDNNKVEKNNSADIGTEKNLGNAVDSSGQGQNRAKKIGSGLISSIVIISLLAGLVSGAFGSYLVIKSYQQTGAGIKQTVIQEDSAIVDVVQKASPAVVSIIVSKNLSQLQTDPSTNPFFFDPFFQMRQQPQSSNPQTLQQVAAGSGFFVSTDGLIMTNKHVVSDASAKYTVLTNDGNSYDATVVAQDPINDLALVRIKISNAPKLDFADSGKIQIGQRVIAIGNSLGQYSNTVTTGIVSGIGRNVTAGDAGSSEQLEGVIQTDAAINPGNSGGPLLDISGNVIGVNTAIDQQGQLVGFAIPSNDANKDIDSYGKFGKIIKPFMGVRYILIDPAVKSEFGLKADNGAWVTSQGADGVPAVVAGGAADKAGIKEGDIIISLNNTKIDQNTSLAELIRNYNPGDSVIMQVLRGGKTLTLKAVLGQK